MTPPFLNDAMMIDVEMAAERLQIPTETHEGRVQIVLLAEIVRLLREKA